VRNERRFSLAISEGDGISVIVDVGDPESARAAAAQGAEAIVVRGEVGDLRAVTRTIATGVAREAVDSGLAGISPDEEIEVLIDRAMWWPAYVPYTSARGAERRRVSEA